VNAGQRIRFLHDIIDPANEDHPDFLLAKKGTLGWIISTKEVTFFEEGKNKPAREVIWDGFPDGTFYALDEEFTTQVIPIRTEFKFE